MVQVTNASFTYSRILFQAETDQTSLSDNPSGGFADMFANLLKDEAAPIQAEPQMQTISAAVDKLTQSIGTLVKSLEEMMNRLKDQLNVSMPGGYNLKQTSACARLEITGAFTDKKKVEDAVNSDCFLQQTFQALRIRYTELRTYSAGSSNTPDGNTPESTQPFSVSFKDGKATINTQNLSDILFDKLIEALDKNDDKNKKHDKALSIPEETGSNAVSRRNQPDIAKEGAQQTSVDWI